ncbi:MAG: ATP-binding protein, partial [Flavobacteriales bacterium]|nr:ATP-binding protein [Flavobacteriales bacterium]
NKFKEALLVDLQFELNDEAYSFQIKDQGEGFDYTNIPDPTHPDNLEKPDGRGIFIMESLSDEVKFQDKGSVVNIKFLRK